MPVNRSRVSASNVVKRVPSGPQAQRGRNRFQRVRDRDARAQEPLERGDQQAAVLRGRGAGAHAVRKQQAGHACVGKEIAACVARDRRILLLLPPDAHDRAEGRALAQLQISPVAVPLPFSAGSGRRPAARPARRKSPRPAASRRQCPRRTARSPAVLRIAHCAHVVDPAKGGRIRRTCRSSRAGRSRPASLPRRAAAGCL